MRNCMSDPIGEFKQRATYICTTSKFFFILFTTYWLLYSTHISLLLHSALFINWKSKTHNTKDSSLFRTGLSHSSMRELRVAIQDIQWSTNFLEWFLTVGRTLLLITTRSWKRPPPPAAGILPNSLFIYFSVDQSTQSARLTIKLQNKANVLHNSFVTVDNATVVNHSRVAKTLLGNHSRL